MGVYHIETFHGLRIFDAVSAIENGEQLPDAAEVAWRIGLEYDSAETFAERWEQFLGAVDASRVTAVVIGNWSQAEPEELGDSLAAITGAAERLPALRALFLGEVSADECEISWLEMSEVTALLTAWPRLEELVVRGGMGLELKPVRHEHLRALRFESGGLPGSVVRAVGASEFPALERLELWLGVDEYGGDWSHEELAPFYAGTGLPALRHLGLEDSEDQDGIAVAIAQAPVVARLESLSLAMGVLTDEGAAALIAGQPLTHLKRLDLRHHYLTEGMQQRLREWLPGVDVDLDHPQDPDSDWRYVAVAE